jgi:hypothetical protein
MLVEHFKSVKLAVLFIGMKEIVFCKTGTLHTGTLYAGKWNIFLLEIWWAEITLLTHESCVWETLLVVSVDCWDDNSPMG